MNRDSLDRLLELAFDEDLASAGDVTSAALVPDENVNAGDPTGCGDVYGATYFYRMLAGDKLADAMTAAAKAAARNVEHRGATRLAAHLRGELSLS